MENTQIVQFDADKTLKNFDAFEKIAKTFHESKALPSTIDNPAKLVMVMQAGTDLGLSITESMQSLAIISGKVSMYGPKVIERVWGAGYTIKLVEDYTKTTQERDGKKYQIIDGFCEATISKGSGDDIQSWTEKYTLEDAEIAGLLDKDNRIKSPKLMLRYRAIGQAVKFFCPQVLGGMSIYEEMRDHFGDPQNKSFERVDDIMDGFETIVGQVQAGSVQVDDITLPDDTASVVDVDNVVDVESGDDDLEVVATIPPAEKPTTIDVGVQVKHKLLGLGVVEEIHKDEILVKFDKHGVKVLGAKQLEIA